jgi:hypothetical protein
LIGDRSLGGNHGTLQGPHADMLLEDNLNADRAADENELFKNRRSTMMLSGSGGGGAGIKLQRRYTVVSGGSGGQGCEIQICRGDL